MPQGLTLQQLQSMGAKPVPPQGGGLTLDQLQKMGAQPMGQAPAPTFSPAPAPQDQETLPEKVMGGIGNFAIGAAKGLGSTVSNLQSLGEQGLNAITAPFVHAAGGKTLTEMGGGQTVGQQVQNSGLLQRHGLAQNLGYGAEQVAELFTPTGLEEGLATKGAELAPKAGKLAQFALKTGGRALGGALDFGGKEYLQSGGDVKKAGEAAVAGGLGSAAFGAGADAYQAAKQNALEKLLSPVETQSVKEAAAAEGRMSKPGIFTGSKIEPSADTKRLASEVGHIVEGKSPQQGVMSLNKEINRVSQDEVAPFLKANNRGFNVNQAQSRLSGLIQSKPLRFITETGEGTTYKKIIDTALDTIKENPKNASGLWNARKQFDSLVENMIPKAFDAPDRTNMAIAANNVRREMNSMIGDLSDSATFKAKMNQLSDMYQAKDVLVEKAAKELGKSKIGLLVQKHPTATKILGAGAAGVGLGVGGTKLVEGAKGLLAGRQ